MNRKSIEETLEFFSQKFNSPAFIKKDPISIPHKFTSLQDREIMGFWTAMLSWGQRITIINKSEELIDLMGGKPFDFIMNHKEQDLDRFLNFRHRTFNDIDALYFLAFFRQFYEKHNSLEELFRPSHKNESMKNILSRAHNEFFALDFAPQRTRKHVSTPVRGSACKRLNMFLRWMVRKDEKGVDFGVWSRIPTSILMIPLDVHVYNVASRLGILKSNKANWAAVEELTGNLKKIDPIDPVRFDYALFGMGIMEKENK